MMNRRELLIGGLITAYVPPGLPQAAVFLPGGGIIAREIGRELLAFQPSLKISALTLRDELLADPCQAEQLVRSRHKMDLESEDVIIAGGWLLSRTEALLCILS